MDILKPKKWPFHFFSPKPLLHSPIKCFNSIIMFSWYLITSIWLLFLAKASFNNCSQPPWLKRRMSSKMGTSSKQTIRTVFLPQFHFIVFFKTGSDSSVVNTLAGPSFFLYEKESWSGCAHLGSSVDDFTSPGDLALKPRHAQSKL